MAGKKKQALDAKRSTTFRLDPEDVVLVDKKGHVLTQTDRLKKPLDEDTIANIMELGVLQNICGEKDGDQVRVVFGRRRILHAREANKRLKKAGLPPIEVEVKVRRFKDDRERVLVMLSENHFKEVEDPISKAQRIQDYIERGALSTKETAVFLKCSTATVHNNLKLLELDETIQQDVKEGKVKPSKVRALADKPRTEQKKEYEKIKTEAKKRRAKKQAAKEAGLPLKAPSKDRVRDYANWSFLKDDVRAALLWAIGDITTEQAEEKIVGWANARKEIEGGREDSGAAKKPEAAKPEPVGSGKVW